MLGRPVVRRHRSPVRVYTRNVARATTQLPAGCEFVEGDLRDNDALSRAMRDARAVYINLAAPMGGRPPAFEPERDGTRRIVDAAREVDVPHLLRISAMGVDDAADRWWSARHKLEADEAIMTSGLPWTIFRPTWFMESLATMRSGDKVISFNLGDTKLRWIAGDDYARQVVAATDRPESRERIYYPQGPELVGVDEAIRRFARACSPPRRVRRIPLWPIRLAGLFSGKARYLVRLLDMTRRDFARLDREQFETDLPEPTMAIEDYVRYMNATGDVPSK